MRRSPFTIPRKIKIRGKTWRVRRWHELDHQARREMSGAAGMIRRDLREIRLGRERGYRLASTFFHEVLHACSSEVVNYRTEEKFIRDVECSGLGALRQLRWRR